MFRLILILAIYLISANKVISQVSGLKKNVYINTKQSIPPPLLEIKPGSISISGATVINGMDSKTIGFDLTNLSGGSAIGLKAQIQIEENSSGIFIPSIIDLPSVSVGETVSCEIPITTNRETVDGMVRIRVEVVEPRGFSPAPFTLELPTKSFRAPFIELVDFSCTSNVWEPLKPIGLDVLVQNTGRGDAEGVSVQLELPSTIACLSENETIDIGDLPKGEIVTLKYDLLVPRSFTQSQISLNAKLSESYGDYGSNWSHQFIFKKQSENSVIRFSDSESVSNDSKVKKGSFNSTTNGGGTVTFRETNADHIVKTVAVVPKRGESCSGEKKEGDELASFTENQLLGSYNIVDRKFIDQTLGEIKFTMSGMTKEDQVLEAGCLLAAEGYVFVQYGCFEGNETVNIKMIHCESGENMWISQGIGASAAETVRSIVEGLSEK